MNLAVLANWIDQIAIVLLVVVVFQTLTRRLATAIVVVGLQGALLTTVAVVLALGLGTTETLFGAILTAAVRMVLVPLFLWAALQRIHVRVENDPVLGSRLTLVATIGLTMLAYVAAGAYPLPGPIASRNALPIGLA